MSNHDTGTLLKVVVQALAAIALGLLGASGMAKLVDPDPTTGAMSAARLPSSNALSRLLGILEIGAALAALAIGGVLALPAGLLYTGFAIFTFSALHNRIPLQSCGCFGREDTPPTAIHVAYNVVAALTLFASVGMSIDPVDWTMPATELVLFAGFAGIGTYASYLLLTLLPQLNATMPTR